MVMVFSIALLGLGFLASWLGTIMVWMSFRDRPTILGQLERRGLRDAEALMKATVVVGILVTALLYMLSFFGYLTW